MGFFQKIWRIIYYNFQSKKIIKEHAYERIKYEDRDVLERIIFPYLLSHHDPRRILDIGREDYQQFYNEFFEGRELWTIDIDPEREEFGAKNHIVDNAANVADHFKPNYFDLVIFNGVFGWGLNEPKQIEKAFSGIYRILKKDGVLIFGWNDVADLTPMPLEKIKGLRKFEPFHFPPLKTDSFKCLTGEHTYNFYIKK